MAGTPIDELINILSEMVDEAWSMPLSGGKIMLDRDRITDLLNEIKTALPSDIQQARAIVESRNELAAAARRDAALADLAFHFHVLPRADDGVGFRMNRPAHFVAFTARNTQLFTHAVSEIRAIGNFYKKLL